MAHSIFFKFIYQILTNRLSSQKILLKLEEVSVFSQEQIQSLICLKLLVRWLITRQIYLERISPPLSMFLKYFKLLSTSNSTKCIYLFMKDKSLIYLLPKYSLSIMYKVEDLSFFSSNYWIKTNRSSISNIINS